MARRFRLVALAAALFTLLAVPALSRSDSGDIVVANRGSGDLSVIDADTLTVETVALPDSSEPMYVSHDDPHGLVWVGDRSNDRVLALDDESFEVVSSVDVGDGVFHQWLDGGQLWVVGDTSDTVSVIDTLTGSLVATFGIPADIAADGGSPHDVFVEGGVAFVSIVGLAKEGAVVQYSTRTLRETGRIVTGGDPHLFVHGGRLHVASQDGSTVSLYQARTLAPLGETEVSSAHGIWVTRRGDVLATNIAGGGTDGVLVLGRTLRVLDVTSTPVATPHNLAVDRHERQVFVTHSGPEADQVSVIGLAGGRFETVETVTVGTNPFGLALIR